jgi:hypothetical protein
LSAVHHVFIAQYGFQGDVCAFHSPYDVEAGDDILTDEEMDPEHPEYIETPELVTYAPGFKFVNVYELDLAYGGPEEGGWWVECGTLICSVQVAEGDAECVQAALKVKYPRTGKHTSVVYHGGDYRVRIEDQPGEDYPQVFPHYE